MPSKENKLPNGLTVSQIAALKEVMPWASERVAPFTTDDWIAEVIHEHQHAETARKHGKQEAELRAELEKQYEKHLGQLVKEIQALQDSILAGVRAGNVETVIQSLMYALATR